MWWCQPPEKLLPANKQNFLFLFSNCFNEELGNAEKQTAQELFEYTDLHNLSEKINTWYSKLYADILQSWGSCPFCRQIVGPTLERNSLGTLLHWVTLIIKTSALVKTMESCMIAMTKYQTLIFVNFSWKTSQNQRVSSIDYCKLFTSVDSNV